MAKCLALGNVTEPLRHDTMPSDAKHLPKAKAGILRPLRPLAC
jgi:hypothetical protein